MNSMPAASKVSQISLIFAAVALDSPFWDSNRFIVLILTDERLESSDMLHPSAARAIPI